MRRRPGLNRLPEGPVAADLVQAQRLNREIRRRTDVDGILPGRDSRIHLVGAILAGQHTKGETAATLASTSWPAPALSSHPCFGPDRPAIRKGHIAGASPARNAGRAARVDALVKKIGFLSFGHWSSSPGSHTRSGSGAVALGKEVAFLSVGHWSSSPGSHTRSASDALLQSIDLAVDCSNASDADRVC